MPRYSSMTSAAAIPRGFTGAQSVAVVALGVTAGCVPSLQPLLLGALMDQGRLDAAQIGQAATCEALGMAAAMTLAAVMLRPDRLRSLAVAAIIGAVAANAGTGVASGAAIIALRGLAGLCSGLLLWILIGYMARAAVPGRTFAVYVTVQASLSFTLSLLLSALVLPSFGAAGGFALLAAANAALIIAVALMPRAYAPAAGGKVGGAPPLAGIVALLGVMFFLAAVMAFWVYVIPLGRHLGHPANSVSSAVSAAIGVQIAGGLAAAALASRLRPSLACLGGAAVLAVSVIAFLNLSGTIALFATLAAFSFCWMFVPPFQMPLLIGIDPTLRTAMLIGSAQLLGNAVGPLLASGVVGEADIQPAAVVSLACAGLCIALTVTAGWMRSRVSLAAGVSP